MSLSPYFYLEKWNEETNSYERVHLYKKPWKYASQEEKERGYEDVDFWPWNGTHEIFSLLNTETRSNTYDSIEGVHYGKPPHVSKEIEEEINDFFNEDSYYKSDNVVRWVTLADLYIEKLSHPKVVDYDAEWEDDDKKAYKDNPINTVIDRIETFVSLGDNDWEVENNKSLIRLVYWVVW